jgi:DNA invertase Pin-like site-specific DNA recombinase
MPVAQYVRASTDHQRYSTQGQSEANARYAAQRGMQIVTTYTDDGRSGLNLQGRPGLRRLLDDVQHGPPPFKAVLVYDVSRWGRFQDVDESAYYEYQCRRAGIQVVYCAEVFGDAEGPMADLIKAIKRAMAGEFSRELSKKVFAGQCRLVERGYRQGGVPGYALRRLLVDERGQPKGLLSAGERKSLQSDRVILVPGPPEEVAIVLRIYKRYVDEGVSERAIVAELNTEGLLTERGKPWCRASVRQVLTNAKYAGANVFNRESFKLRASRVQNPEELWVRNPTAYEAIVPLDRFHAALAVRAAYTARTSTETMLTSLRRLLKQHGRLTAAIIEREGVSGKYRAIARQFGSLEGAYRAIGFETSANFDQLAKMRRSAAETHRFVTELSAKLVAQGVAVERIGANPHLDLSTGLSVRLVVMRHSTPRTDADSWRRKCKGNDPDLFAVYEMAPDRAAITRRFLFPRNCLPVRPKALASTAAEAFQVADDEELVLRILEHRRRM